MDNRQELMVEAIFRYLGPTSENYSRIMQLGGFRFGNYGLLEDAFQEAAFKAGRKAESYREEISLNMDEGEQTYLRRWFTAIFLNQLTDWYRRGKVSRVKTNVFEGSRDNCHKINPYEYFLESNFLLDAQYPENLPMNDEETTRISGIVQRKLQELLKESREVLQMHYFDGLKYREISARLGIPIGTVKSRIHSAKKQFLESLADDDRDFLKVA